MVIEEEVRVCSFFLTCHCKPEDIGRDGHKNNPRKARQLSEERKKSQESSIDMIDLTLTLCIKNMNATDIGKMHFVLAQRQKGNVAMHDYSWHGVPVLGAQDTYADIEAVHMCSWTEMRRK